MRRRWLIGTALGGLLVGHAAPVQLAADEAPAVVASILPVAGIAAAVMDGVGEPRLLLDPGASPHAYSLRPSEAQALTDADLILWIGAGLEGFLARPLDALGGKARVLELGELAGLTRLGYREDAVFETHDHAHEDDHGHDHADDHDHAHDHAHDGEHDHAHAGDHAADHGHQHGMGHAHGDGIDWHVWLSPANARVMAEAVASTLAEIDPAHAEVYAANAAGFAARLDVAEAEIRTMLEPLRGRPFIVFHDAYHYFEDHFRIEAAGAIHLSPELQPGASRVAEIQERIREFDAVCVFAEPQFEPRLIATVTEGSNARTGVLDPLGSELELGPDNYRLLLQGLARSFADCLAR